MERRLLDIGVGGEALGVDLTLLQKILTAQKKIFFGWVGRERKETTRKGKGRNGGGGSSAVKSRYAVLLSAITWICGHTSLLSS
jgi:hypothetical protein